MHSTFLSVFAFAALLLPTQALYFYIDGPTQKCFFEELPKDTLVVGACPRLSQRAIGLDILTALRPLHGDTVQRSNEILRPKSRHANLH